MRKITSVFMLLLVVSIFCNCSKDNNNPIDSNGNPTFETFTAKVDDNNFATEDAIAVATSTSTNTHLTLTGTMEDGDKIITISIMGFNGVGEYDIQVITNDEGSLAAYYEGTSYWGYDPQLPPGKLVVTSYRQGESIKGTFHFKAMNNNGSIKTITDGAFNVISLHFQE